MKRLNTPRGLKRKRTPKRNGNFVQSSQGRNCTSEEEKEERLLFTFFEEAEEV